MFVLNAPVTARVVKLEMVRVWSAINVTKIRVLFWSVVKNQTNARIAKIKTASIAKITFCNAFNAIKVSESIIEEIHQLSASASNAALEIAATAMEISVFAINATIVFH